MALLNNLQLYPAKTTVSLGEATALGKIYGARPVTIYGYNPDIDTTGWEDLQSAGGTQSFPATAAAVFIASAEAEDKHDGTGARTVRIVYVTDTFVEKTYTWTAMEGATPVTTPTGYQDVYRINEARIMTYGSSGVSAGIIGIGDADNSPNYVTILAGENFAKTCSYTCPVDKKLVIESISVNGSNGSAATKNNLKFQLVANYDDYLEAKSTQEYVFAELGVNVGGQTYTPSVPFIFPAGVTARVRVSGDALTDNVVASACMRGYLVPV